MIPMGRLSTEPVYAEFVAPDDIDQPNALTAYELGGVALSDSSGGLMDRVWIAQAVGETGEVYLSAPGVFETLIFTAPGITSLDLAFDQNMRPFFAYVQDGQAKFRWYDTVLGANRITNLGAGDRSPRCCMDDKRSMQTSLGTNDVILAYLRGTSLYYRQQRDRFETEYLLTASIPGRNLLRVGMNQSLRLQFMFEGEP